jgi:serine/threonine-protein kinase HipA
MPDVSVLDVLLYGREIGTLTLLPGDRTLFAFNRDYIDDPGRPTLSLSFKDAYGGLITDLPPTRTRVPRFFANLLPEGALRDYLAGRAGVNARREFFLLWVLGRDLPGAVTISPAEGEAWPPEEGGEEGHREDRRRQAFRFSLAGVQLKFSALQEATGGLTIPAQGVGGSWIVKLPSTRFEGVPENEYAMMTLARAVGIDVPDVRLVPLADIGGLPPEMERLEGPAVAVKRFDRSNGGELIHIEDFAQVFGVYPEEKYERATYRRIAAVIWAEQGEDGVVEFIRRLVFNTLIGNADMHIKNWSLIYPDRRNPILAPGYDFVSTIGYLSDENMALKYARSKKMTDLSRDELAYLAAKARLPEKLVLDTAADTVTRFHEVWGQQKSHLGLPARTVEIIESHATRIPLAAR